PFKQIVREKNIQNKNNPESEPSLLPGEEYIKTPVEQSTLSKSDEVDSLNRRVAMQKFLKKMEAEFGLSVTEIVEAFSQLSPQDLMKPPDQSVAKVVKLLGLDQEGQSKALSFFQDLLEQSESVGVNDYLKSNGRKISLEIISEEQSRKRDLENSLAKMSQAFFVDNHNRLGNKEADQNEALKAGIAGGLESAKEYHSLGFGEKGSLASTDGRQVIWPSDLGNELNSVNPSGEFLSQQKAKGLNDEASVAESNEDLGQSESHSNINTNKSKEANFSLDHSGEGSSVVMTEGFSPENSQSGNDILKGTWLGSSIAQSEDSNESLSELDQILENADFMNDSDQGNSPLSNRQSQSDSSIAVSQEDKSASQDHGQRKGDDNAAAKFSDPSALGLETGKSPELGESQFTVQTPKMSTAQESANVKEVVDKAQVLVRNGGGEMRIKLNPEGAGEVTLKVVSDGGRVSVEMIASNSETKKMLEKGLTDLKDSFSTHRLTIDQIKVGSPEQISKHLDQQMPDPQQRHAQQFLEEFRQNNQSWRQGFVGLPALKSYRSQTQDGSSEASISLHSSPKKNTHRRLDLVA
ncbi:MAG: flagellar hook-length control protein FliK, partial [Bdellovibrionales bacterium]|nr:flagellar hook-length control protein FliK [Bdellovibrionales bacterium]